MFSIRSADFAVFPKKNAEELIVIIFVRHAEVTYLK